MSLRRAALLILIVVMSLVLAACDSGEADTGDAATTTSLGLEVDPTAPLISLEAGTVGFQDFSQGNEKSFGLFVCVTGDDVELESVEPIASEGDIEVIGATLYVAEDAFVGAINDYPPRGLSESFLNDIPGAVVTTPCDSDGDRSQVIVGTNRTGAGGGKIEGIRINYSGGALDIGGYNIILCGDQGEYCENVNSKADSPSAGSYDEM